MAITKTNYRQFGSDFDAAVAELGKKYGVKFDLGNAKIDLGGILTMKVTANPISSDGEVASIEAEDFKLYSRQWGLSVDDLKKEISYAGNRYEIIGAKPRSYKFPILCRNLSDGKEYKLPLAGVKKALGK